MSTSGKPPTRFSSTASHHHHVSHASSATPTGTTTITPTSAKAPTVTLGAYSIYWWDCQRSTTTSTSGSTGSTSTYSNANGAFRVGLARLGACGSRDNMVQQIPAGSGSGGGSGGQQPTYAICGGTRTLGESYYFHDGGGGMGSCNPILETGGACCNDVSWDALVSCLDVDGSTECKVQRVARCDDVCVGGAEVVTVDNAASATGTAGR